MIWKELKEFANSLDEKQLEKKVADDGTISVNWRLYLKPKKEPQFGDKILVKDKGDSHWKKDRRFLWMSKSGFPISIQNDDFDCLDTNINDTALLATHEEWKWPDEEQQLELDEISKLDYHQRDSELDRIKILEGKVEEMIDVVNKLIRQRNEI